MSDWLMEQLLTWRDNLLDLVTLGWWSRHQGEERIVLHRERGGE